MKRQKKSYKNKKRHIIVHTFKTHGLIFTSQQQLPQGASYCKVKTIILDYLKQHKEKSIPYKEKYHFFHNSKLNMQGRQSALSMFYLWCCGRRWDWLKGFTERATYSTCHDFLRFTKCHDFIMWTLSIQHEQIEALPFQRQLSFQLNIEYIAN